MGTPEFSLPTLKSLIKIPDIEVVCVYSQPPKPKGRGQKVIESPIHEYASLKNIPVETPKSFKTEESISTFRSYNADLAVVIAYGLILPTAILEIPRLGCFNLHGSLLPSYRGAAPVQRSLQNGDKITGVTLMRMDEGMDTGDMIAKYPININDSWTSSDLFNEISLASADLIDISIEQIVKENMPRIVQKNEEATYADKIQKDEGIVRWNDANHKIVNNYRGFFSWPGIWTFHNGNKIKIFDISVCNEYHNNMESAGEVISLNPFVVKCGYGYVKIDTLQKEGGKPLPVKDFINGYNINIGDKFG